MFLFLLLFILCQQCQSGLKTWVVGNAVNQISDWPFLVIHTKISASKKISEWTFFSHYPSKFIPKSFYFYSHHFQTCSHVIFIYIVRDNNISRKPHNPSIDPTSKSGGRDPRIDAPVLCVCTLVFAAVFCCVCV